MVKRHHIFLAVIATSVLSTSVCADDGAVPQQIKKLEDKVETLESSQLDTRTTELETKIIDIQNNLANAANPIARVKTLEEKVATLQSQIATLQNNLNAANNNVARLLTTVKTLTSDVSAIQSSKVMELNPYLTVHVPNANFAFPRRCSPESICNSLTAWAAPRAGTAPAI